MNLKKQISAVLAVVFLFNMIGFQTSFAENASAADMAPQEQTETQIVDDGEELGQVELENEELDNEAISETNTTLTFTEDEDIVQLIVNPDEESEDLYFVSLGDQEVECSENGVAIFYNVVAGEYPVSVRKQGADMPNLFAADANLSLSADVAVNRIIEADDTETKTYILYANDEGYYDWYYTFYYNSEEELRAGDSITLISGAGVYYDDVKVSGFPGTITLNYGGYNTPAAGRVTSITGVIGSGYAGGAHDFSISASVVDYGNSESGAGLGSLGNATFNIRVYIYSDFKPTPTSAPRPTPRPTLRPTATPIPTPTPDAVAQLSPIDDAQIFNEGSNTNKNYGSWEYGTAKSEISDGVISGRCILYKFDLLQVPSEGITDAVLHIFHRWGAGGTSFKVGVLPDGDFNNNWDESSVTYDEFAESGIDFSDVEVIYTGNTTATNPYVPVEHKIPVADCLNSEKSKGKAYVTFVVYNEYMPQNGIDFTTKEWNGGGEDSTNTPNTPEAYRPTLSVNYNYSMQANLDWISDYFRPYRAITDDIDLPSETDLGASVTWSTSNASRLTNSGQVSRPGFYEKDVVVTLTAHLTLADGETAEKEVIVIVKREDTILPSDDSQIWFGDGRNSVNYSNQNYAVVKIENDSSGTGAAGVKGRFAIYKFDLDDLTAKPGVERVVLSLSQINGASGHPLNVAILDDADASKAWTESSVTYSSLTQSGFDFSELKPIATVSSPGTGQKRFSVDITDAVIDFLKLDEYDVQLTIVVYSGTNSNGSYSTNGCDLATKEYNDESHRPRLTVESDPDAELLNAYMSAYTSDNGITGDITLPADLNYGSSVSWTTSNEYYINTDGTVTRPDLYGSDTYVTLTAALKQGNNVYKLNYDIKVLQDPTLQPSTDIPIRSIGFEYDQIYPDADSAVTAPEISAVTVKIIDEENGKYQLYIRDDQYSVDDSSANPFFFWSAREGTFLPDNTCSDYSSVYFTVDESAINKKVKVIVGVGDGLGYVDKKAIILQGESVEVETQEAALSDNAVALAVDQNLSAIDTSQLQGLNLAIGIDMSKDMLEFDASGGKAWTSVIEGLIDSAPEDATFDIYSNLNFRSDVSGKTAAQTALTEIVSDEYNGTETALALIENTAQMLDRDNGGNNSAIVFVQGIDDADELEMKIAELEKEGIAVYAMVLGGGYEGDSENIINCLNELELRLNISKLYEAFSNVSALQNGEVALMSADGTATLAANDYVSDFKKEKHMFTVDEDSNRFGQSIASVLNLYGCLPAIASKSGGTRNSYDLFDNTANVYQLVTNNASGVNVNDSVTGMFEFYEEMKGTFESDANITINSAISNAQNAISKNLMYRFPVVITNSSGTKIIIGGSGNNYNTIEYAANGIVEGTIAIDDDTNYSIIDTYLYLLQISNGTAIVDNVTGEGNFYSKISFNVPSGFSASNGIKFVGYNGTSFNPNNMSISGNTVTISGIETNDKYLAGINTIYNGAIPQIYNSTKYYFVKQYADESTSNEWYHEYLFKATNLGIIGGDENGEFKADDAVTRSEMFKMILEAAKIDIDNSDSDSTYWARGYINYMQDHIDMYKTIDEDNDYFYAEMPRAEVAYVIYTIFIIKVESINVPSNVYDIPQGTSCIQNTRWTNKTAFDDYNLVAQSNYNEGIRQMYYNGIMSGSLESDGRIYFKPNDSITRSEACKVIIMCLFDITESVEKVNIIIEGEKTVYIMLYDSEVAKHSTEPNGKSRYRDSNDQSYQYTVDFFENYLSMIGDKKVAFVISVRDVDFDTNTSGYQTTEGDVKGSEIIPADEITQTRMNNIINKTASKSINIINNIKTALSNVNEGRTDKLKMPEIYLGTPHTNTNDDWINQWISEGSDSDVESIFLNKYQYVAESIYNNVVGVVGEGTITGIYFGRENPDEMYDADTLEATVSYKNASNISDFIHSKGKKILWIPFSTNAQEWENIGKYVNQGKSYNNSSSDLFDIVMMQPGIFYSNYSDTKADIDSYNVTTAAEEPGYDDQKRKIKDLYKSAQNNQFYMYDQPVGGAEKLTNTLISFEIEYDISLVTGRVHNSDVTPAKKADNFRITYDYYKELINDATTSYAIYAGGPNEQNYSGLNLSRNNNVHCYINHPSFFGSEEDGNHFDAGDKKAYSWFYVQIQEDTGDTGYYSEDYNDLIYDMTKGLLYGEDSFSSECKEYLGWD